MAGIELIDIHKTYRVDNREIPVLNGINLSLPAGRITVILGQSGCGKTTLLRILAGLEQPSSGKIMVNDRDITVLPPAKRNFGMMFQSYALFPNLTAAQNIAYGLQSKKMSKKDIEEKVREVLVLIDLEHIDVKRKCHSL